MFTGSTKSDAGSEMAEWTSWPVFERHWLSRYDAVWTMSADDNACALDEGAPAGRTVAVANGVDIEIEDSSRMDASRGLLHRRYPVKEPQYRVPHRGRSLLREEILEQRERTRVV